MLLAISTTRGIQAESLEKASGSSATAPVNEGTSGGPVLAAAAPAEPQVQPVLLLGEDPDRDVQPADQRVEVGAEDRAPVLADVAQLAGQRRRDVPGRGSQQLHERGPRAVGEFHLRPAREGALQSGDDVVVARPLAQDAVVDQLAQRPDRRVLVGDPGEQQLLEAHDGRLRLRTGAREGRGEAVQHEIRVVADVAPDVAQGAGHAPGRERLEARGQQVRDLVQQAEGHDLAGSDRGRARLPDGVHPRGEVADRREIGDDEVAACAEQGVVDARSARAPSAAHGTRA